MQGWDPNNELASIAPYLTQEELERQPGYADYIASLGMQ